MFDSDFFNGFPQQPSSFIDDAGNEASYEFPSFYEASRGMTGIFTCSWTKARALMPSARLLPVPAGLGKALLAVGAFEYLNPKGMAPYNEIMFGFPVAHIKAGLPVPRIGVFMGRLIVDQLENVQRGKHLWGMQKSMGEFDFRDEDDMRVCEVKRNGRMAIRFEAPKTGRSRKFKECRFLVTQKDDRLLRARSCMSGRKVDKNGRGALTFGADPFSVELESLGASISPLRTSYMPNYEQVLCLASESEPI